MRILLPLLAVWLLTPAPLWAMQAANAPAKPAAPNGPPVASQGPPAASQGPPAASQGQPAANGQPPASTAPAAPAPAPPAVGLPENYTYDPAGRRDPFL